MSKSIVDPDGDDSGLAETIEYEYNDASIRVSKSVDGAKTLYLVDGNNPTGYAQVLAEMNAVKEIQRAFTLGLDVIAQAQSAATIYHLLYDGHGSTRGLVDNLGLPLTTEIYAYDAYGLPVNFDPATALTNLLYSGEIFDQRIAMQYLRARYYDVASGTFNRLDPFAGNMQDPQSLHKYLYVHGDPVQGIDPTGLNTMTTTLGGLSMMQMMVSTLAVTSLSATIAIGMHTGLLPHLINDIQWMLSDTSQSVREAWSALVSHATAVVDAMSEALVEAALATGRTLEALRKLRMFPVVMSVMPHIYLHNVKSLALYPQWYVLNYHANPATAAINRATAIAGNAWRYKPHLGLNSLDEFPFASTREGGGLALVAAVPLRENCIQGGLLGAFYRWSLRGVPGPFMVVPVPV